LNVEAKEFKACLGSCVCSFIIVVFMVIVIHESCFE
jgi:hypothetical protein